MKIVLRLVARYSAPPLGPVPAAAGFKFVVAGSGFSLESEDVLLFAARRGGEGPTVERDAGSELTADMALGDQRIALRPRVSSDDFYADDAVCLQVSARAANGFVRTGCVVLGGMSSDFERGVSTDFHGPRLVEVSPFKRVYELEYRLNDARAVAAWHSARIEIDRGRRLYPKVTRKVGDAEVAEYPSWEPWGDNRGPLILEYETYLASAAKIPDYAGWFAANGARFRAGGTGQSWCIRFQGYHYRKAGFDCGPYAKDSAAPGFVPNRFNAFDGVHKLEWFWWRATPPQHRKADTERHPMVVFPRGRFDSSGQLSLSSLAKDAPRDDDACRAWLRENLNPWGPRRGDLFLMNASRTPTEKHPVITEDERTRNHGGMVAAYDPETFTLTTYEGNHSERGGAWVYDLTKVKTFYSVYAIGRFVADDFKDAGGPIAVDPQVKQALEKGSPIPEVESGAVPFTFR